MYVRVHVHTYIRRWSSGRFPPRGGVELEEVEPHGRQQKSERALTRLAKDGLHDSRSSLPLHSTNLRNIHKARSPRNSLANLRLCGWLRRTQRARETTTVCAERAGEAAQFRTRRVEGSRAAKIHTRVEKGRLVEKKRWRPYNAPSVTLCYNARRERRRALERLRHP